MQRLKGLCLLVLLGIAPGAMAQEGHPLVGTWLGEWRTDSGQNFLTVIMNWDGERISGIVNPGPGSSSLAMAELDSSNWTVRLQMDVQDESGESIRLSGEGQLDDIGSYTRSLRGTWRHEGESGEFTLTRQGGA